MGKNQDPGSGINIPDPPHWFLACSFTSLFTYCERWKGLGLKFGTELGGNLIKLANFNQRRSGSVMEKNSSFVQQLL
jgi:hypothetical protein